MMLVMVTSPIESFFMRFLDLVAACLSSADCLATSESTKTILVQALAISRSRSCLSFALASAAHLAHSFAYRQLCRSRYFVCATITDDRDHHQRSERSDRGRLRSGDEVTVSHRKATCDCRECDVVTVPCECASHVMVWLGPHLAAIVRPERRSGRMTKAWSKLDELTRILSSPIASSTRVIFSPAGRIKRGTHLAFLHGTMLGAIITAP
jgi:hypothetical protein